MSRRGIFKLLLIVNLVLAGGLGWGLHNRKPIEPANTAAGSSQFASSHSSSEPRGDASQNHADASRTPAERDETNSTPFAAVYSTNAAEFANNLRAIRCPEQTVNDIITAEVHRGFKAKEEALRPTPADHVPFSWSARTTEPRLLERREEASALAREEAATLRDSLGCVATVPMPIYAMTSSDQRFEEQLAASAGVDSCAIRQVHDTYWADVQALLQRTKGFWLPDDVAELQALKEKRKQVLGSFLADQ